MSIEDAVYDLERLLEKQLESIRVELDRVNERLAMIDGSLHELQRLHYIDNVNVSNKHPMLRETYEKHQFAKRLILGEDDGGE